MLHNDDFVIYMILFKSYFNSMAVSEIGFLTRQLAK